MVQYSAAIDARAKVNKTESTCVQYSKVHYMYTVQYSICVQYNTVQYMCTVNGAVQCCQRCQSKGKQLRVSTEDFPQKKIFSLTKCEDGSLKSCNSFCSRH